MSQHLASPQSVWCAGLHWWSPTTAPLMNFAQVSSFCLTGVQGHGDADNHRDRLQTPATDFTQQEDCVHRLPLDLQQLVFCYHLVGYQRRTTLIQGET